MEVLTDTNILIRGVHRKDAKHREALQALRTLRDRGDRVCVVAQNLYEFWAVATRPIEGNGLGLTSAQTDRITSRIEEVCTVLRDPPEIYDEWRRLVVVHAVSGKQHTTPGWSPQWWFIASLIFSRSMPGILRVIIRASASSILARSGQRSRSADGRYPLQLN